MCHLNGLRGLGCAVVGRFGFGRWDVAEGLVEAPVVEPVDPFQGGDLDVDWRDNPEYVDYVDYSEELDKLNMPIGDFPVRGRPGHHGGGPAVRLPAGVRNALFTWMLTT